MNLKSKHSALEIDLAGNFGYLAVRFFSKEGRSMHLLFTVSLNGPSFGWFLIRLHRVHLADSPVAEFYRSIVNSESSIQLQSKSVASNEGEDPRCKQRTGLEPAPCSKMVFKDVQSSSIAFCIFLQTFASFEVSLEIWIPDPSKKTYEADITLTEEP